MAGRETIDWSRVYDEAYALAKKCLSAADAEDAVGAGVELVFSGKAPWDENGKYTLPRHVVAVGLNVMRNQKRKVNLRRRTEFVAKLAQVDEAPSPESAVAENEERRQLFEGLYAACEDDDERAVLDAELRGIRGEERQMEACKLDRETLRKVRKRIGRRLDGLVAERESPQEEEDDEEAAS